MIMPVPPQFEETDWNGLARSADNAPEGIVTVIFTTRSRPDDILSKQISFEEFCKITEDDKLLFIVSTTLRIGWAYFTRHLELVHFPPLSDKGESFILFDFKWEGMPFSAVGVPSVFREDVLDSIKATKMHGVETGLPVALGGKEEWIMMPLADRNVITLENEPDHICYKNDESGQEWEFQQIKDLERKHGINV